MNTISRTITGLITILLGVVLICIPFFTGKNNLFVAWIWGVPILIIGFFVLFNKKEDKIEERKDLTRLNSKNKIRK